jgi:hypothetical protein
MALAAQESNNLVYSIFCEKFASSGTPNQTIAYLLVGSIILLNLYSIYFIYTKRNSAPIHQRAPWLAIYQTALYMLTIFFPLLSDVAFTWTAVQSIQDIPFSRRAIKFSAGFTRFSLGQILPFRFAVIWFQWKGWEYKSRGCLWAFAISVMTSQKKALALIILVCLALFVLLYGDGGGMLLMKSKFDWFDPDCVWRYQWFNITLVRANETILGLVALYFVR